MQQDINADCIEGEDDQTIPGLLQETSIEQRVHVSMHGFDIALAGCWRRSMPTVIQRSAKIQAADLSLRGSICSDAVSAAEQATFSTMPHQ